MIWLLAQAEDSGGSETGAETGAGGAGGQFSGAGAEISQMANDLADVLAPVVVQVVIVAALVMLLRLAISCASGNVAGQDVWAAIKGPMLVAGGAGAAPALIVWFGALVGGLVAGL